MESPLILQPAHLMKSLKAIQNPSVITCCCYSHLSQSSQMIESKVAIVLESSRFLRDRQWGLSEALKSLVVNPVLVFHP